MIKNKYESHAEYGTSLLPFINRADRLTKRRQFVSHFHENVEILHCTSGSGTILIDGIPYPLTPGDTVVVNANSIHYISSDDFAEYKCLIVFERFFYENGIDPEKLNFTPLIHEEEVARLFLSATDSFASEDAPLIRLSVMKLIYALYKSYSSERASVSTNLIGSIKSAVSFIHGHYSEPISLADVANAAGLSRYYFVKKFKQITGKSFSDFLAALRCDHAKKLLRSGRSVAEVCYLVGYTDPAYFSRVFKKTTGKSPSKITKGL